MSLANDPLNQYGDYIKVVLLSSVGTEGLNFKEIRRIHIMEPQTNYAKIEQIIGRGSRMYSHVLLKEDERNITPIIYISTYSDKFKSYDERVLKISLQKYTIINKFFELIKEVSVNCFMLKNKVKCRVCKDNFNKIYIDQTDDKDLCQQDDGFSDQKEIKINGDKQSYFTDGVKVYIYHCKSSKYIELKDVLLPPEAINNK